MSDDEIVRFDGPWTLDIKPCAIICDNCVKTAPSKYGSTRCCLCQAKAKVPKWISVEERLPEKNGSYLVYGIDGNDESRTIMSVVRWKNPSIVGWEILYVGRQPYITHWMPLPDPPETK